jgi:hypothetical protein
MEEQFGEIVKIVKIHHLHKDGEEEMKLLHGHGVSCRPLGLRNLSLIYFDIP